MQYWQEGLSAGLARFDGKTYEMYNHGLGKWGTDMPSIRVMSEVLYSGDWYDITEDEVRSIIARVAERERDRGEAAGTSSKPSRTTFRSGRTLPRQLRWMARSRSLGSAHRSWTSGDSR